MSEQPKTLVSSVPLDDEQKSRINAITPNLEIHCPKDLKNARTFDAIDEHTAILYGFRVPKDILKVAPNLEWVQIMGAGIDRLKDAPIMKSDITITNASGISATPIAEYVVGTILGHYRWILEAYRAQREKNWGSQDDVSRVSKELRGRTIGILGYGAIGREVARLAKPFGTKILALKRSASKVQDDDYVIPGTGDPKGKLPDAFYTPDQLNELLPQCDIVVLAVPSTNATYHMLGLDEFRVMKKGAYLINIARGNVIDEDAFIEFMKTDHLSGAALDVFNKEPLPEDSPLWTLKNVLVTPHISGASRAHLRKTFELFLENLHRYADDRPLLNLVKKDHGY